MQPSGMDEPTRAGWLKRRYPAVRRIEVTTYSFAAVPYLVVGTDRIATMHARLARLARKSLPLRLLPTPMPSPAMQQTMQWHKYRTLDPGLVWLRGLLHEAVAVHGCGTGALPMPIDRQPRGHKRAWALCRPQRIRLNQSSDSPADSSASTAAPSANSAEISVSFFSTVSRELSVL